MKACGCTIQGPVSYQDLPALLEGPAPWAVIHGQPYVIAYCGIHAAAPELARTIRDMLKSFSEAMQNIVAAQEAIKETKAMLGDQAEAQK